MPREPRPVALRALCAKAGDEVPMTYESHHWTAPEHDLGSTPNAVDWTIRQLQERLFREYPWQGPISRGDTGNLEGPDEEAYCGPDRATSEYSLYVGQPRPTSSKTEIWPLSWIFIFSFKERHTRSHAIHLAAASPEGVEVVERLLELAADANDDFASPLSDRLFNKRDLIVPSGAKKKSMKPLHFAAGTGSVDTIKLLIQCQADVNGRTTLGGQEDYTALHEASYHGRSDCVGALLALQAEVNAVNRKQETALHVVAQSAHEHNWLVAKKLIQARVDLSALNGEQAPRTALMVACQTSFPSDKLWILMQRCIDDILLVAMVDPTTTLDMLENEDKRMSFRTHASHHHNEKWRKALVYPKRKSDTPTYEHVLKLMRISPEVAGEVLDILTVRPEVGQASAYYHPIPRHSRRDPYSLRRCQYVSDVEWTKVRVNGKSHYPAWHDHLAPRTGAGVLDSYMEDFVSKPITGLMSRQRWREHTRVEVKMLKVPNIINLSMIFALSETPNLAIFRKPATQAILDCAWTELVRSWYNAHFFIRAVELLVLLHICIKPPKTQALARYSWSILCVTSLREVKMELLQAVRFQTRLSNFSAYIRSLYNWMDIVSILSFALLVWVSADDMMVHHQETLRRRQLLATVCFQRWIQIVHMLCAYSFLDLGYSLIPLMSSICKVGGMTVIAAVFLFAFLHSFLALDSDHPCSDNPDCGAREVLQWASKAMLHCFRLLVMGDGVGIDWLLKLNVEDAGFVDEGGSVKALSHITLYFSVIIFCVFILNLYIAVHGQAYQESSSIVMETFYAKRASVVLGPMLQPCFIPRVIDVVKWRSCFRRPYQYVLNNPTQTYVVWMVVGIAVWLILVTYVGEKTLLHSFILFLFVEFGDHVLLRRPLREHACGDPVPIADIDLTLEKKKADAHTAPDARQIDIAMNAAHLSSSNDFIKATTSVSTPSQSLSGHMKMVSKTQKAMQYDAAEELYLWWCAWDTNTEPKTDHLEVLDRLDSVENLVASLARSITDQERGDSDTAGVCSRSMTSGGFISTPLEARRIQPSTSNDGLSRKGSWPPTPCLRSSRSQDRPASRPPAQEPTGKQVAFEDLSASEDADDSVAGMPSSFDLIAVQEVGDFLKRL